MSGLDSKDFGFWRSLGSLHISQVVFAWDFITALVISVGGTLLLIHNVPRPSAHVELAGTVVVVAAALFGVILAGFAIVAALLGDKYSRLLEASGGSALQMLRHFLVVGGLLVSSIVLSIAFEAGALALHRWDAAVEHWLLGVMLFVFFWSLFSTLELMKLILGVAITNTAFRAISNGDAGEQGDGRGRSTAG